MVPPLEDLTKLNALCRNYCLSARDEHRSLLWNPSRLCDGYLPASLMFYKDMYEPKLAAIVLTFVLPFPDNPPSYEGDISICPQPNIVVVERLVPKVPRAQVRKKLRFVQEFARGVDEGEIVSQEPIELRDVALHLGFTKTLIEQCHMYAGLTLGRFLAVGLTENRGQDDHSEDMGL